ncbi:tyrosine-protein kinase abl-1-like isoform X2 [Ptychodera flava]
MSYRSKTRSRDNIAFIGHQHVNEEGSSKPMVHSSTRRYHSKGTTVKRTVYSGMLGVRIKTKKGLSSKWDFVDQFVVVTSQCLSYYDSPVNWAKDDAPKFSIAVSSIQGVQSVDSNAFPEPTVFQVTYCSDVGTLKILYFSSRKNQMVDRQEWLTAIRKVCSRNCYWLTNYHGGIYHSGVWTCCRHHSKTHIGCQKTTLIGQPCIKRENLTFSPASKLKTGDSCRITTDSNYNHPNGGPFSKERSLTRLNSKNIGHIEIKNFREQPWFYSDMQQGVAESLLRVHEPGSFLVRQFGISMFLSVQTERYIMHIPILNDMEEYWLAADKEHRLGDVIELIEYYKNNDVLGTCLRSYPSKTNLQELWQFDLDDVKLPQEDLYNTKCWIMWLGHWTRKDDVLLQKMKKIQGKENAQKGTFRRYTSLLMNLEHDNVARVYGMSINEPISYVVSEAGIHGFLDEYLRHQASLEDEELVAMATDVCRALEYLESQKIVHNEVVAENCIVSENKIVKLGGFQSARYEWNKDMLRITVIHKVPIPAPEARKDGESNAGGFNGTSTKSDVWAFGLLLWIILLRNEVDLPGREAILNGQFWDFPEVRSIQLKDIICACVKREPKERPSFKSLLGHLEFMLEGRKTIYGNFIPDTVHTCKDDSRKHKQGTPEFLRERRRQWRNWFCRANYGTSSFKRQSSLQDDGSPDSKLPCKPPDKHPRISVRRCSSVNDLPLLTTEEGKNHSQKLNKASSEVNVSKSPRELLVVPKGKRDATMPGKIYDILDTDEDSSTPVSSTGSLPNLADIARREEMATMQTRRKKRSLRSGMFAAHLSLSFDENTVTAPLMEQLSNDSEYDDRGRKMTLTESEGSDESSKCESSNGGPMRQKSSENEDGCVPPALRSRRRPVLRRSVTEDSQSDPEEFGGVWYMSNRRSPSCETTSTETSESFSEREKERRMSAESTNDDGRGIDRRRRSSILLSDLNRALEALEKTQTVTIQPNAPEEEREKMLQTIREEEEKRLKEIDELSQMILQRVEKAEMRAKSAEEARQIAETKLRQAELKLAEVTKQVDRRKSRDESKSLGETLIPLARKLSIGMKDDKELARTKHELEAAKKDSEEAKRRLLESETKLHRLESELQAAKEEPKKPARPKFLETESNV